VDSAAPRKDERQQKIVRAASFIVCRASKSSISQNFGQATVSRIAFGFGCNAALPITRFSFGVSDCDNEYKPGFDGVQNPVRKS
jgi:hypothetical protein